MGWTRRFPEMALRGDINVVFKRHAHELVEEELYRVLHWRSIWWCTAGWARAAHIKEQCF